MFVRVAGLRNLTDGHPRVAIVVTDGKSINAEKLASFSGKVGVATTNAHKIAFFPKNRKGSHFC